jgi:hypothetical protein
MKIIREHINEKFVEDSDPVTDMGIGIRAQISRWMKENRWTDTDDNALVTCAWVGKLEWVKFLIAAGTNIHIDIEKALRNASYKGHLEVVKELIKAGADVHADKDCALRWAMDAGQQDVVDFLEDYIANEKNTNSRPVRESLLEKFVEDSDPVTDMGIGTRAQISRWMEERRQLDTDDNALAECAEYGKLDWVKFLIAAGANVHFANDYALRWASYNGHLEVVKELLKAGANIKNGTALYWAIEGRQLDIIKELIKAKVSTNKISNSDISRLRKEGCHDILDILLPYIKNKVMYPTLPKIK